jgi:mono/diheme cytochrome c family protein
MRSMMVAFLACGLMQGAAWAQGAGDAAMGHATADRLCSECHAIEKGQAVSPHMQAPTFTAVANAPGRTATSLRVWFQSPHRSMPDYIIGEKESADLIAYILSLQTRS